jgi:RNA polymerase sigma-70 factor (ECF subfamily)
MAASLDERVRALLDCDRRDEAATVALEALGPEILGYLCAILGEDDGQDAFSAFAVNLWSKLPTWRGEGSLRAWAYRVAWNAAGRIRRDPYRRRRLTLPTSAASRLAASIASSSGDVRGGRRDRLRRLREALSPEEQSLLVLHVDRGLGWSEIAAILAKRKPIQEATLRKRYQRLKRKLTTLAQEQGLVG